MAEPGTGHDTGEESRDNNCDLQTAPHAHQGLRLVDDQHQGFLLGSCTLTRLEPDTQAETQPSATLFVP
jgi:hypothetical protein